MKRRFHLIGTVLITCAICLAAAGAVPAESIPGEDLILHLSEISGMDAASIEQILRDAGISEEQLLQMSEDEILEGLRITSRESSVRDFSYLFTDESVPLTLDGHTLERVAVYSSDDAISPSLLIDYEEQRIYYSGGMRIFDNLDLADTVQDLDSSTAEEVKEIVREVLEKAYDNQPVLLSGPGGTLSGLAIETDQGVASYTIQSVEEEASREQSNYISRIFRVYYESTGQGW